LKRESHQGEEGGRVGSIFASILRRGKVTITRKKKSLNRLGQRKGVQGWGGEKSEEKRRCVFRTLGGGKVYSLSTKQRNLHWRHQREKSWAQRERERRSPSQKGTRNPVSAETGVRKSQSGKIRKKGKTSSSWGVCGSLQREIGGRRKTLI